MGGGSAVEQVDGLISGAVVPSIGFLVQGLNHQVDEPSIQVAHPVGSVGDGALTTWNTLGHMGDGKLVSIRSQTANFLLRQILQGLQIVPQSVYGGLLWAGGGLSDRIRVIL